MKSFRARCTVWILVVMVAWLCWAANSVAGAEGFSLRDKPGEYLDVLHDGRVAARYMYACDTSTPERTVETNKPYLHVFDAAGRAPITNGPAGLYPHHRGIFIGWNKIECAGQVYNSWAVRDGVMLHKQFQHRQADARQAAFTALVHWNDAQGAPYVEETRTMTLRRGPGAARLLIDFTALLKAVCGDMKLGGNADHGGVQYRAANELDLDKTVYVFPKLNADPKADVDYPWVGMSYTLAGQRYSVVHMNHAQNPQGTLYSAYRDYGRFGAFFEGQIAKGQTLTVKYRLLVADGEMLDAALVQASWDEFAGKASASPVPPTTVRPADAKAAKKPAVKPTEKPAAKAAPVPSKQP